jgi:hypothetical protein
LIEDEVPFRGRQRPEFQSSTLACEEGVVLEEFDGAMIGECRSLTAHGLDALDTRFDFDIARHKTSHAAYSTCVAP